MSDDRQGSLFDLDQYTREEPIVNWGWLEVEISELGTNKPLVPNSPPPKLGTNKHLVPNLGQWKPPIGCLQQKWIKNDWYWYWRYYNNRRKKVSLYLGRDYHKAIAKAQKIGVPPDANHPKKTDTAADPQAQTKHPKCPHIFTPTTHTASDLPPAN